jgi:hypothetical protein
MYIERLKTFLRLNTSIHVNKGVFALNTDTYIGILPIRN